MPDGDWEPLPSRVTVDPVSTAWSSPASATAWSKGWFSTVTVS